MKSIFPKEILHHTSEMYRYNFLKRSQPIYMTILLFLVSICFALPFIEIDLYTTSPGMIRPSKERNVVTSPINGKIKEVLTTENAFVEKGDTLVTLDDLSVSQQIKLQQEELDSLKRYVDDLKLMSNPESVQSDSLASILFKSQFTQYLQKIKGFQKKLQRDLSLFKRQKHLYKKGVIARVEFEKSSFELEKTRNELVYFKKHQQSLWQNLLHQKKLERDQVRSKLSSLENRKSLHHIISPSTGNIQDLKGFEKNNFLYTGSSIAEISPQTDLVVECYVSPVDIGLLKKNHPVKFQIDAFNHNHWGSATGQIIRINQDISSINNLPMFKVLCSINETGLFLKGKSKGNLRKGMTLSALFFIEKRSLFQLLFDKLEDWYKPS